VYTFFTKAPPSKYVGVLSEVWQPFKRHGKPVFLRPDEVKGTNLGGILDGSYLCVCICVCVYVGVGVVVGVGVGVGKTLSCGPTRLRASICVAF